MDLNNKNCWKHKSKKAGGMCTVKGCIKKFLCLNCLISHSEHAKRLICFDEIFDEDSLFHLCKEKHNKSIENVDKVELEIKRFLEETDKIEKKEKVLEEVRKKFSEKFNLGCESVKTVVQRLKSMKFTDESQVESIVENIEILEDDLSKEIDKIINLKNKLSGLSCFPLKNYAEIEFDYYDTKGILYWIGTDKGTRPWINPIYNNYIRISSSSIHKGNLDMITGNCVGQFYTQDLPNSWIMIQFVQITIKPTHYTIGYYKDGKNNIPRNWSFEGSEDGINWKVLREHKNDNVFNQKTISQTFTVENYERFYSFFRVINTGVSSSNAHFFLCSGLEIYGLVDLNN